MKQLIRYIFKAIGYRTCYHVAYSYNMNSIVYQGSMQVVVSPWIHTDNYISVVDYIHSVAGSVDKPNILSITKLGL